MPSLPRCTLLAALLSPAAFALFACGSTNEAPSPPATTDAGAAGDDAAPRDASPSPDATPQVDAMPDGAAPIDLDGGESGASEADAPEAPATCTVRTSGTDAGGFDPTFHPFQWTPPRSLAYSQFSYSPTVMLAAAPGGDVYMAVPLTEPEAGSHLDVVVLHVLASGALDGSFGGGGSVTLPGWSRLEALIVDHNGDVVITGVTPAAENVAYDFGLVALHADGSPDFTVDPIAAGAPTTGTQPCPGCIVDGDDGYLTPAFSGMYNVAPNGTVTKTDNLPQSSESFVLCAIARGRARVGLSCGYGGAGGTEEVLYDLHGVLDPAFGPGGAIAQYWDFNLDPWIAWDGSLYVTDDPNLDNPAAGGAVIDHFLANGTLDPAYSSLSAVTTAAPVHVGAARCDGTELFIELPPAGGVVMEVLGAAGPPLASAGAVPITFPDSGAGFTLAVANDPQGAALVVSQVSFGAGMIELDRILPSE